MLCICTSPSNLLTCTKLASFLGVLREQKTQQKKELYRNDSEWWNGCRFRATIHPVDVGPIKYILYLLVQVQAGIDVVKNRSFESFWF